MLMVLVTVQPTTAGMYEVVIKTAYELVGGRSPGTDAPAFITLHGPAGTSPKPPIGDKGQSATTTGPMLETGFLDRFILQLDKSVGNVNQVVLTLEPSLLDLTADWGVEWVRLTDMHSKNAWKFCANKWVNSASDWRLTVDKPCATGECGPQTHEPCDNCQVMHKHMRATMPRAVGPPNSGRHMVGNPILEKYFLLGTLTTTVLKTVTCQLCGSQYTTHNRQSLY
jgi:hypothetical protein